MSDVTDAAELALKAESTLAVGGIIKTEDGRTFIGRRNDFTLQDITAPNQADVLLPKHVKQAVQITDTISMCHYLNRFKNAESILFADIARNVVHGVIDYHGRPAAAGVIPATTSHTARLTLAYSQEWQRWVGANERLMEHVDFASFLEENSLDVVSPAGADLLELIRDLQVKADVHFSSSVRHGDKVSVSYGKDENATTKDNIELPVEFLIAIPVYFNEPPITLRCLMRRKISQGELELGYKIIRLENARQAEFQRIVGQIEADTDLAAIYGTIA